MNPDLSAEFRLVSSSLPLVDLAATVPDARFELDEVLRAGTDRPVLLCWVAAQSFRSVEAALDADASIAAWTLLEATVDRRLYRLCVAASADAPVAIDATFIERGTTPISATITGDGWLMRARFPDRTTLADYRDDCDRRGPSFVLERLYRPTPDRTEDATLAGLTRKQREALVLAHEAGYYELPREATTSELSDRLGISRRSLSDRLRRAERQLVETAIANDRLSS